MLFGCLALSNSQCTSTREYLQPEDRVTQGTAYVLPDGQFEASFGLVGLKLPDFGADLSARYGIEDVLELRLNLAHAAVGVLSLGVESNLVDTRYFGLGLDVSVVYLRPRSIWLLPADIKEPLDDVQMILVPTQLISSFPIFRWFSVHMAFAYTHGELFGTIPVQSDLIDAGVGIRTLSVEPSVHFYISDWIALIVGIEAPIVAWGRTSVDTTLEVAPGVRAGTQSTEWVSLPIAGLENYYGIVELSFGESSRTALRLGVVRSGAVRAFTDIPLLPTLSVTSTF